MAKKRNSVVWIILGLFAFVLVLGGCNTMKGVGKDIERTGEKIQGEP